MARARPTLSQPLAGHKGWPGLDTGPGSRIIGATMGGESKTAMVALRRRRDEIIEDLSRHFAEDTLDLVEFEARVDLAHRARTIEQLEALLADLEPVARDALVTEAPASTALTVHRAETKNMVAIMGGVDRKGSWVVGKRNRVLAFMGGVDLDFREVELPPGVTEVRVFAMMGGVDIIVPPTLAVECDGIAIMGGFDACNRAPATPDPDQPLLRISGFCLMGGVDIETRLPGETRREAKRRARKEARERRKRALGPGADKQLGE
jgi:hypothetical protein